MSAAARVRRELREIGLVTLYFLACFLFFLSLKWVLLDEYGIQTTVLGTAVVGALVVAKVVVLLDKTSFGERFASTRLWAHVLWRSLVYTVVVFVVTLGERLFDLYRESHDLATTLAGVWAGEDVDHFVALNLCVATSFLIYNAFSEIGRHLGGGDALRSLFFARREAAGPG